MLAPSDIRNLNMYCIIEDSKEILDFTGQWVKTQKNKKSATGKRLIEVYRKRKETLARNDDNLESGRGRHVMTFEEILQIEMFFFV